jgi:hypothetical protein
MKKQRTPIHQHQLRVHLTSNHEISRAAILCSGEGDAGRAEDHLPTRSPYRWEAALFWSLVIHHSKKIERQMIQTVVESDYAERRGKVNPEITS